MPSIRSFLDASTAHVTEEEMRQILAQAKADGPIPISAHHEYGCWLYVYPDGASDPNMVELARTMPNLHRLLRLAETHNCGYVALDQDGPVNDELPTFEW